ncbi:MAG: hypothetical protein AAGL89_18920 [Pseudomonadota bacterium]
MAEATKDVHLALHCNPVLSVLTSPSITPTTYLTALRVLGRFLAAVEAERVRHMVYPEFSLATACHAVADDIGNRTFRPHTLTLRNPRELLGALYVAHGASFGRSTFQKTVTTALPDMTHDFVSLRVSKSLWQELVQSLENAGHEPDTFPDVVRGAEIAFACVNDLCTAAQTKLSTVI